jgi:2-amino-4-hydroxy-6-hydroxymethyldihydropteridine diphosphokinase
MNLSPSTQAYIALGANLGNAVAAVEKAVDDISRLPLTQVLVRSSLYQSAPLRTRPALPAQQPTQNLGGNYINAVVKVQTQLGAMALLRLLQTLEKRAGRERTYQDAPRPLDLDLLMYGALCLHTPYLQLPHPGIKQRAFVLWPLQEIAPEQVDTNLLEKLKIQQNICLCPTPASVG